MMCIFTHTVEQAAKAELEMFQADVRKKGIVCRHQQKVNCNISKTALFKT